MVSNNILNYLNENYEIYYCGKEPGAHYKTQDEINEMIVKLVKEGHIVGRLKGGDPYVFGRGGEEVLSLIEEDIEFEVIPGVTSPISVLNYAGIPITQREIAQSFHIVTGMTASKKIIGIISKEKGTLVFMMGLNKQKHNRNLISNGKDINTKAAVVIGELLPQNGTFKNIEAKVKAKLKSPKLLWRCCRINNKLNWYERKSLLVWAMYNKIKEQSLNLRKAKIRGSNRNKFIKIQETKKI